MKHYKHGNYTYIDKDFSDLSIDDFLIENSDIHVSKKQRYVAMDIKLIPQRNDVKEAMELLGITDFKLTYMRHEKFHYRGRKTDEQRQQAIDEAIEKLKEGKEEKAREVFSEFKEYFLEKIERHRENYIATYKRRFTENDPFIWNGEETPEFMKVTKELNSLNDQIKKLENQRNELEAERRKIKNKIVLKDIEQEGLSEIVNSPVAPEFEEEIKQLAKEGKLFKPEKRLSF